MFLLAIVAEREVDKAKSQYEESKEFKSEIYNTFLIKYVIRIISHFIFCYSCYFYKDKIT